MYYTTEIEEQVSGYFCSVDCINAIERSEGERVKMHTGQGDPELCDSLLCTREDV
jgi:hypothetical protein